MNEGKREVSLSRSFESPNRVSLKSIEKTTYDGKEPPCSQCYPVQPFWRLDSKNQKKEGLDCEEEVLSCRVETKSRRIEISSVKSR